MEKKKYRIIKHGGRCILPRALELQAWSKARHKWFAVGIIEGGRLSRITEEWKGINVESCGYSV